MRALRDGVTQARQPSVSADLRALVLPAREITVSYTAPSHDTQGLLGWDVLGREHRCLRASLHAKLPEHGRHVVLDGLLCEK